MATHVLYECDICSELHPWNFDGDCRDDSNRYADADDYLARERVPGGLDAIRVRTMAERVEADLYDIT